jgi:hypothetical protein
MNLLGVTTMIVLKRLLGTVFGLGLIVDIVREVATDKIGGLKC